MTKNNANNPAGDFWASKFSLWCPADGRQVPGSRFELVTSEAAVPDMRGKMPRLLNVFDDTGIVSAVPASQADPDNRTRGSYQEDEIKAHGHTYGFPNYTVTTGAGPYPDGIAAHGGQVVTLSTGGNPTGTETRPKNIALYAYIRIN